MEFQHSDFMSQSHPIIEMKMGDLLTNDIKETLHLDILVVAARKFFERIEFKEYSFGIMDIVVTSIFLILLIGETKADEEMWKFQEDKRKRLERGEDMSGRSPFYREGMYKYSRHPNYFCEVKIKCYLINYTLACYFTLD